jgi:hypothetical protein
MVKLVVALALLGALAAGVFVAPISGRTIAERWSAAPDPAAFARSAWREGRAALEGDDRAASEPSQQSSRPSRTPKDGTDPRRRARPTPQHPAEHHTPEERAALDRLVSERSR